MDAMTVGELVEKLCTEIQEIPVMVETFPTNGTGYVSVKTASQGKHDGEPCIVLSTVTPRQ